MRPPLPPTSAPGHAPSPVPSTAFKVTEFARAAGEYVNSGHATIINDRIHLPNCQPIPFDSSRRGLQASIDLWLTSQMPASTLSQAHAGFARETPPHFDSRNTPTSCIEEVIESHILQVKEADTPQEEEEEFSHDIFEVFAAKKKKRGDKATKVPKLATPPPTTPAPAASATSLGPTCSIDTRLTTFVARQAQHCKDYQATIKKQFKTKQAQEAHVNNAREKYEQESE